MAARHKVGTGAYFNLSEAALRRRLVAGTQREIVETHLGKDLYAELRALAIATRGRRPARGPRVYILHGIMGSRLGHPPRGARRNEVVWVDPRALAAGRLTELALGGDSRVRALGVQTFMYLKLKLALERAGCNVEFYAYDWRQDVLTLGAQLRDRIRANAKGPVSIVAHSMGGLVARAAMQDDRKRAIAQLIMLGTPNFGSFATVLALRGAYPPVHKIAMLDHEHDADAHAQRVFATFTGLYQLLPAPERLNRLDLRRPSTWPRRGPRPLASELKRSANYRLHLAPADARFTLIAGVGQPTVTAMRRRGEEFEFEVTRNGDGTVPLSLALLAGAKTYYVAEGHTELPSNSRVVAAVLDLLVDGNTRQLAQRWATSRAAPRWICERDLRFTASLALDWEKLSAATQRELLEGIVFPGRTAPQR